MMGDGDAAGLPPGLPAAPGHRKKKKPRHKKRK
jgi:hypothetical protein